MRCLRQRGPGRKLAPVLRNPGGPCRPRPAPKTTLSPSRPPASRRPERCPSAAAPGRPGGRGLFGGRGGRIRGLLGAGCPGAEGPGPPGGQPSPARSGPLRRLRAAGLRPRRRPCGVSLGKRKVNMPGGGSFELGAVRAFQGKLAIPCPLLLLPPFPTPPAEVCLPVCGRVAAGLWPWGRRTNAAARGGHGAPRDAGRVSPRPAPRPAPSAPCCCAALAQPLLRTRPEPNLGRRTRQEGSGRRVRREPPPCRAPGAGAEGPEQSRLALKWRAKRPRGGAAGPRRR